MRTFISFDCAVDIAFFHMLSPLATLSAAKGLSTKRGRMPPGCDMLHAPPALICLGAALTKLTEALLRPLLSVLSVLYLRVLPRCFPQLPLCHAGVWALCPFLGGGTAWIPSHAPCARWSHRADEALTQLPKGSFLASSEVRVESDHLTRTPTSVGRLHPQPVMALQEGEGTADLLWRAKQAPLPPIDGTYGVAIAHVAAFDMLRQGMRAMKVALEGGGIGTPGMGLQKIAPRCRQSCCIQGYVRVTCVPPYNLDQVQEEG